MKAPRLIRLGEWRNDDVAAPPAAAGPCAIHRAVSFVGAFEQRDAHEARLLEALGLAEEFDRTPSGLYNNTSARPRDAQLAPDARAFVVAHYAADFLLGGYAR